MAKNRNEQNIKIILFGKDGQVGFEIQRAFQKFGQLYMFNSTQANFENPYNIQDIINNIKPDIVINAAAYTAVDKAESEPTRAKIINTDTVEIIAKTVKNINALLVHYSTDYIFDGTKKDPYTETDQPNPLNIYGKTKYDGEIAIQNSKCRYLIFRTSWIFSAHGKNFIKKILELSTKHATLNVITDQVGIPTSASFIADVTLDCLKQITSNATEFESGIYNLAAAHPTNWFEFARMIIAESQVNGFKSKLTIDGIISILSKDLQNRAKRPQNSVLDTSKLSQEFHITIPDWKMHFKLVLAQIIQDTKNDTI